ncbi:SDR family NAD(P)-dependent oxidoreductase [Streptomyces sp. NPDC050759]|uniref:SDR family NAD(P)-dependent oxidoreductase n=1 Tax=Streptomyces sp. NPDC050759 TaxID=3365635 RepID=UPI0037AE407D
MQGFIPAPYTAVYGASKHAIEGYSESLDQEVREYGVRSLLVEPAYTNTRSTPTARSRTSPCRPTPISGTSSPA